MLDVALQQNIWERFLSFLSENSEQFDFYYEKCPPLIRETRPIEKAHYIYRIINNPGSIDSNDLIHYISETGDDIVLCIYLSRIEKNTAIAFLDEHSYLYKNKSKI